ncbi:hypothetical protein [uncultured Winogradskyella sp.]|uniref:hypothetical protein n=1 Tax=uncultured Winogradskyella sp. TaxID=395353 RepID=UPI00262B2173|nr:hypothetical protein [uncultured Winogradskyella sp.]
MKNLLRSSVLLAMMSCLLFFGCSVTEDETPCNCEEATYIEEKFLADSADDWQLNRVETNRVSVECQDETDFVRTGNGTEVTRIECN